VKVVIDQAAMDQVKELAKAKVRPKVDRHSVGTVMEAVRALRAVREELRRE
jgi:hypothetical protein